MSKVTVKIAGALEDRAAAIDGFKLLLMGMGDTQAADVTETAGTHELSWVVQGAPCAKFTLSLSGDTEAWSKDLKVKTSGPGMGFQTGTRKFEVK
jgi:hypothetical protein